VENIVAHVPADGVLYEILTFGFNGDWITFVYSTGGGYCAYDEGKRPRKVAASERSWYDCASILALVDWVHIQA
jgi:hypothetical protein